MFAIGDHVELYPTIPSGKYVAEIDSGSVGIIRDVKASNAESPLYLVEFFGTDRGDPGESVWLDETALFPTDAPLGPYVAPD